MRESKYPGIWRRGRAGWRWVPKRIKSCHTCPLVLSSPAPEAIRHTRGKSASTPGQKASSIRWLGWLPGLATVTGQKERKWCLSLPLLPSSAPKGSYTAHDFPRAQGPRWYVGGSFDPASFFPLFSLILKSL